MLSDSELMAHLNDDNANEDHEPAMPDNFADTLSGSSEVPRKKQSSV
jgi:hypothetical protein